MQIRHHRRVKLVAFGALHAPSNTGVVSGNAHGRTDEAEDTVIEVDEHIDERLDVAVP